MLSELSFIDPDLKHGPKFDMSWYQNEPARNGDERTPVACSALRVFGFSIEVAWAT
jgi:hypothetical protein